MQSHFLLMRLFLPLNAKMSEKGRKIIEKMQNEQIKEEQKDKENLKLLLEEYIALFRDNKKHQKVHKKEPCPKCELAKQLLKKLKDESK